jgi:putative transcriptional regulator
MIKNRLKVLLAERDLNYTRLSEMTGISISALSEIGRGDTTKISFDTLDKICAALECQVGDLLVWKPNEEKRSADRKRISR